MAKKRTTKEQFEIYVRTLENNKLFVTGRLKPGMNPEILQELWTSLVDELNSCGSGPVRTVEGWKKVFTEWKSLVKKRAREGKLLSEVEKRYLEATGVVAVSGITSVQELGVEDTEAPINADDDVVITLTGHQETHIEMCDDDFEDVDDPSSTPKVQGNIKRATPKTTKSSMKHPLLNAYAHGQAEQRDGLLAVASALQEIARERKTKITVEQFKIYLKQLEKFKCLTEIPTEEFAKLCNILNNSKGATKSVEEWKKSFTEWTSRTKRKARELYVHRLQTGGGMPIDIQLNEIENWLLNIITKLVISGMDVPELCNSKRSTVIFKKISKSLENRPKQKKRSRRNRLSKNVLRTVEEYIKNNKRMTLTLHILLQSLEEFLAAVKRLLSIM
ncbi:uncharacterized protein LOC116173945 isoform X1 [Photinus pyralis]|uniref:uncharacterized protein LOC116160080 isoform X1 n=1 Tax=Photinus pyralis TaxID=7054 RepID=UPI00126753D6|nr:uncharacterized protein LOC116160080 isoform X1 [Photinus pyralis]XP_031329511.1 uncharacterized protein LOC116160459 isoform X1 [Photinus pyralis]XP_031347545.1 uncharacterized protein LOC116173945 isoform X1 [Photinus pyralis]